MRKLSDTLQAFGVVLAVAPALGACRPSRSAAKDSARSAETASAPANAAAVSPYRVIVAPPGAVDSIVLERTACFGTCPAYRLRISAAGAVHFTSRNFGDSGRVATGRV